MLSCTAPPPPPPGTIHPSVHFSTFHCFHSRPQLFTHLPTLLHPPPVPSPPTSSHTYCSGSPCPLHGLCTPLSLPCLLQNLHVPWGPLLPHPFRLQLSPGSPPLGPPPCLLSLQLLPFHSLHIPVPCGPFSGRNGTTAAPGRAGESKKARAHQEREESEVVRGRWGQGPGRAGGCGGWGK